MGYEAEADEMLDEHDWKILGAVLDNIHNEKKSKRLKGLEEE